MPEGSNDWIVYVGKKEYLLTPKQYSLVIEATKRDVKLLHLDDFSISLPHISSMQKVNKAVESWKEMPTEMDKRGLEKLRQMKKDILGVL